ncbi:hypothetical protein NP493_161g03014 [Ridgeia piscesae]|uniref:UspA domain-containing protein n=1 Tax=Ridgeia piscesae TaxID=27915 RepID=A0AAD9P3R3_RIDPI|nr:hypothetical protein NP493_161g03014 [Ridgeia piscesae]
MPQVPSQQALLIDGNMWDDAVITQKAKVKTLEDKFSAKMLENGIPGSIRAMFSNKPGELLVQTAIEEKAIMIVTGSRGLGKMRRTILGSVSDYVLHNAQCPVFICRKGTL